jgi:flavin reductase (DIM6/NTAB) family NADH-FMN oxidoreductase RutF
MNFHISMHPTETSTAVQDSRHLRNCLGAFATGVTIVSARAEDGGFIGLTANSFSALSLEPPLVLWSLNRKARTLGGFLAASHFAVSILAANQLEIARRFAGSGADRFAGLDVYPGLGGAPLVADAVAWFECATRSHHEFGDHTLFIGEVLRCNRAERAPLLFSQGEFALTRSFDALL